MHKITNANIKDWAKNYEGELFDGILCDPPYELGFMGKSWDSSGIAFDTEMWADLFKLVKPGGHLLAFSGSRTYHRMAVAIEDAGFEIRDMIEWVYGSGFPKSLNIGKAVDKIQGNERDFLGIDKSKVRKDNDNNNAYAKHVGQRGEITKGTSPYEGYGTALKPAHEPCVLARKPLDKGMTVANNVLKHGTGGLNIDGSRVSTTENRSRDNSKCKPDPFFSGKQRINQVIDNAGRFPANLIHDGSDEVVGLFPDSKTNEKRTGINPLEVGGVTFKTRGNYSPRVESGSAARFFYCAKASKSERNAGLEGFEEKLTPKMDGGEFINPMTGISSKTTMRQNHHPTVKPLSLTKHLATLIKPPTGGRLLVPFSGSGSEMIGALQAGWEYVEGVELTEEYIPIAEARIKYWTKKQAETTRQLELV